MLSSLTRSQPMKSESVGDLMTPSKRPRKRFTVFCWNAMALTTSSFAELLQWVALQRFDVAFIQSTHWTEMGCCCWYAQVSVLWMLRVIRICDSFTSAATSMTAA